MSDTSTSDTDRADSADDAELGNEKPKKLCQWKDDYTNRPCGDDAVTANFARMDSRVNDHGVHVTTEARIVWVCEEHAGHYEAVPDREADVRGRSVRTGTEGNDE